MIDRTTFERPNVELDATERLVSEEYELTASCARRRRGTFDVMVTALEPMCATCLALIYAHIPPGPDTGMLRRRRSSEWLTVNNGSQGSPSTSQCGPREFSFRSRQRQLHRSATRRRS
jgi:hypothetical protein